LHRLLCGRVVDLWLLRKRGIADRLTNDWTSCRSIEDVCIGLKCSRQLPSAMRELFICSSWNLALPGTKLLRRLISGVMGAMGMLAAWGLNGSIE
jgi:hypothetical protein